MSIKKMNIIIFLSLIVVWQTTCTIFEIPKYIFPTPTQIIEAILVNFKLLLIHTSFTVFEAVIGMIFAIIIGLFVAVLLFKYPRLEAICIPYINVLQTIPAIVIAPLFALWFGFGLFPKVLLIVIFCSFPIIISTISSFKEVDEELVLYLKTLEYNDYNMFKHLYFPNAAPAIFTGIKISVTYALVNAIFAEYMGAKYGLGIYLNRASASFNTVDVFAVIVVIIVVTLTLIKLVSIIENKIIKWR